MYKAGIAGATGYTGIELVQLIHRHPHLEIGWVTSESKAGSTLSEVHAVPWNYPLISLEEGIARANEVDVVFLCLPHAASIEPVRAFQAHGVRIIDLSADFRLADSRGTADVQLVGIPHQLPQFLRPRTGGCGRDSGTQGCESGTSGDTFW